MCSHAEDLKAKAEWEGKVFVSEPFSRLPPLATTSCIVEDKGKRTQHCLYLCHRDAHSSSAMGPGDILNIAPIWLKCKQFVFLAHECTFSTVKNYDMHYRQR